jgi:outer membrane protein TolC
LNTVIGRSDIAPRRAAWAWVAGVWTVICAGCAHYQAVPLEPEQSADRFAARRLDAVPLRQEFARLLPQAAAAWPPRAWDRAELLAVALTQNPQLAVLRAQVEASRAHETTASQMPNPDLTLQSEYAPHDPYPWLYGISLNWLLRSPERRRLDIQIAGLATSNARLELMDQAWSVRSALATALSEWEEARRRSSLLARLAQAEDGLVTLEQARVEAGEDAPSEVWVSRQALLQVQQQQTVLRQIVVTAQAAAAKALGLPPQALDDVTIVWPDWGAPPDVGDETRRTSREKALLSRADLGQALGEYAAAEAKLRQAIARQYPEFILSPGYYWDHGIAKFPFDLGFTLPLDRNRGEIAEAFAGRELAARRMLALQADIYGQIVAAERAEHTAASSVESALGLLQTARRQAQAADLGLRLGAVGREEQLGAQIAAMRAELDALQARAQWQSSRNTLEDALRAPLSGPELELAKALSPPAAGGGS